MTDENESTEEVVFLNPFTCGIYKDGGARYKIDPQTGRRTDEVDNELDEHVGLLLSDADVPGAVRINIEDVFGKRVLVPRYYDTRWLDDFKVLLVREGLESISLGELVDGEILASGAGMAAPATIDGLAISLIVKVSDIRSLRINVNPTNLVTQEVAESFWRGTDSGLRAWDVLTPNRASSNIGEFAVMLPGEERVVITKEVFIVRVVGGGGVGWSPFYLLWALCLKAVRKQWQRVALMQTNREDVSSRYREILLPLPRSAKWAESVSAPFRDYFTTLAAARTAFVTSLSESGYEYIASAHSVGSIAAEPAGTEEDTDGEREAGEEEG